jgi:hypothetical protein
VADAPDRQGISEIRHVEGLYAFWDELLRRHPGLIIDSYASGGRRIDFETTSRSVALWRSDYCFEPDGAQSHSLGINRYIPCSSCGCNSTDACAFRSSLFCGMSFSWGYPNANRCDVEELPMRIEEFRMLQPLDTCEGPLLRDHRGLCCRDYDGTEVSHPSFAFPEVRDYVQSLLAETASYDIDGLNLIFFHGQPFVLYEKPVVEAFRRETGLDPAALREKDPRWKWYEDVLMPTFWYGDRPAMEEVAKQRVISLSELSAPVQLWLRSRATAMTEFIRGLREMLDKQGKKQKLCTVVYANEPDSFF